MSTTPSVEIVDMTPAMALGLLEHNTRNRALRRSHVARLADAIRRGEWQLNGEPVQVAEDGSLLNGQHRLTAIVEADRTVQVLVIKDLPKGTQDTMDSGSRRRLADVLELRGETDVNALAALLNLLHRHRAGVRMDTAGNNAPTTKQALNLLEAEPLIRDQLQVGRRLNKETGLSPTVGAVMHYLFAEVDREDADEFVRLVGSDSPRADDDPIAKLRAFIARERNDPYYRQSIYVMCAVTIKAFNAWRLDQPMAKLGFTPGGRKPETFPVIKRFDE